MRIIFQAILSFMLLFLGLAIPTVQAQERLALITALDGSVLVGKASGGTFESADWGTQLFEGDQVKTEANASASILFSNNNLLTLGANSSITIAAGPAPASTSPIKTVDRDLLADVSDLTMNRSGEGDLAALGGLRSGGKASGIEVLLPRNTKIKTATPHFSWYAATPFEMYTVKVLDNNGVIWQGTTDQNHLVYPDDAPPLKPETPYLWQVEGEEMLDTVESPLVTFQVLSAAAQQEVTEGERKIQGMFEGDQQGSNYHYVLGTYYAKKGLLGAAIGSFTQIAEQYPDAALPQEILGKLYYDIGLKDNAVKALQQAISLSQRR